MASPSVTSLYTRDLSRTCPDCQATGKLRFHEIPPSTREWSGEDGSQHVQHTAISRDYWCSDCDCEFTLTNWNESP